MKFQPLAVIATGEDANRHCVLQWTFGEQTYVHNWGGIHLDLNHWPNIDPLLLRECVDPEVSTNRFTAAETFVRLLEIEYEDSVIYAYDPYRYLGVLESDFEITLLTLHERILDIRSLAPPKADGVAPTLVDVAAHFGLNYTPTGRSEDEANVIRKIVERKWKVELTKEPEVVS